MELAAPPAMPELVLLIFSLGTPYPVKQNVEPAYTIDMSVEVTGA